MPVSRRGAAATVTAAVVLFAGSTLGSYAANGGPLLLGKSNTASKTTKLKTTGSGAALSLKSKAGKPALKISNSAKVAKLNADLVDGLEGDALKNRSYVYDLTAASVANNNAVFSLANLPPGKYIANYSVLGQITGGGSLFGCYLVFGEGPGTTVAVGALGADNGTDVYQVSGGGYIDTTTAVHRFTCARLGGTSMTIPAVPQYPARLVLTRVDDVSTTPATGADSASPRGLKPSGR
jgi:hypothetical protein